MRNKAIGTLFFIFYCSLPPVEEIFSFISCLEILANLELDKLHLFILFGVFYLLKIVKADILENSKKKVKITLRIILHLSDFFPLYFLWIYVYKKHLFILFYY